ncbi:hypothetical protein [Nostoc sp. CCY 9925]|uniref:hypothetical protein n=1 Tax=Nostoc sp. CCY 9925 TaxID=3103865 RepID=UPI0039C649F6
MFERIEKIGVDQLKFLFPSFSKNVVSPGIKENIAVLLCDRSNQFKIATSANTTTQGFIYNSTTGTLFFDQDGSAGEFTKVQYAQVSAGLADYHL